MFRRLKRGLRTLLQSLLHRFGYHVIRLGPAAIGGDPYCDLATFVRNPRPVILDIGANKGQTVRKLRKAFPDCTVHSFEPSPSTFIALQENCRDLKNVYLNNRGMGATSGELQFLENVQSELSSFLPLGADGWGEIIDKTVVPVDTVDHYCEELQVEYLDILKTDTQGFDLEVLKGAERMLSEGRVGLIYTEVLLAETYRDAASLDELCALMKQHGYRLVSFYRISYRNFAAVSTDALFAHPRCIELHAS